MKKIGMLFRIFELLVGIACIGFLLYEFIYFVLAPFYNGGYLPTLTYSECGINGIIFFYLLSLESSIMNS